VLQDLVQCCGWKFIEPTPVRVQQQKPPVASVPTPDAADELIVELRKLAAAEQAWADASRRFQQRPCDRTAAGVVEAQLAMILHSAALVTYLRERTPLLNLTPR
jgi:hypothetical protein